MEIFVKPDWAGGVKETFEYRTTVFTTESGREQRSAERQHARRDVEFSSVMASKALRRFKAQLHGREDFTLYIPDPVSVLGRVSVYTGPGSTIIRLDVTADTAWVGRKICISRLERFAFAQITSVVDNRLTLSEGIATEVMVGDEVRLCIEGLMGNTVSLGYLTDSVASSKMAFSQRPGNPNLIHGTGPYSIWNGREVFNEQPDWGNPPSVEIITPYEITDFGRGVIATYDPIKYISKVSQLTFVGREGEKINRLVDFYHRMRGRLHEFWCPSWTTDYELAAPIVNGSTSITVTGRDAADYYNGSTVEKAIAIRRRAGQWHYAMVNNATTNGVTSVIHLTTSFDFDLPLDRGVGVYSLNVCRFATDSITVAWITEGVGQTVFQITTLEALAAEVM